jgi:hypothetical protein
MVRSVFHKKSLFLAGPAQPPIAVPPQPAPQLQLNGLEEAANRLVLLQTLVEQIHERAALLRERNGWNVGEDVLRASAHHALDEIEMRDDPDLVALNDLLGQQHESPSLLDPEIHPPLAHVI